MNFTLRMERERLRRTEDYRSKTLTSGSGLPALLPARHQPEAGVGVCHDVLSVIFAALTQKQNCNCLVALADVHLAHKPAGREASD